MHANAELAVRKLRSIYPGDDAEECDPLFANMPADALRLAGRVCFALGRAHASIDNLAAAARAFSRATRALALANGADDPSLAPVLHNHAVVLCKMRRFRAALRILERTRALCDGLLGGPAGALSALRTCILQVMVVALEGMGDYAGAERVRCNAATRAKCAAGPLEPYKRAFGHARASV